MLVLYTIGITNQLMQAQTKALTSFRPVFLFGYDPLIWGLVASIVLGVIVTLLTDPPDEDLVSRMFDVQT